MRTRITPMLALAAALSLGATVAFAQVTDSTRRVRSTTRIPITKEAPGDIVPARVDTVTLTVYRTDTLRVNVPGPTRVDTVTTTVTRYDTTHVETMPAGLNRVGGLYFGLGLGETNAHGSIRAGQTAGFTAQGQLGWQSGSAPFGIRLDANYARFGEERLSTNDAAHPDVLNLSGDVKLDLSFLNVIFPYPRFGLYAIGGPTYTRYKALRLEQNVNGATAVLSTGGAWSDKFGYNVGGGAGFGWGRAELFIESRYFAMTPTNSNGRASQIPIIIGLNWY